MLILIAEVMMKNRKSTTEYLLKLFKGCTIRWNTKRQASISTASTKAKYMGLFEGVREAL
jgi:hypothetical protein